jgi:hypothetical protein
MASKNGGPAFPHAPVDVGTEWATQEGMSLRDYFAIRFAAALAPHSVADGRETAEQRCARRAYEYADAMLDERWRTS